MRYENDELGVAFTLPDAMTVRQQLAFRAQLGAAADGGPFVRYWQAAPTIVTEWQCERIPDMTAFDLDGNGDAGAADIIVWVGNTIAAHMADMETPPKN